MRYLLVLTGDARYGDSMEQVLYNTVLGAKPIREEGWSFYYSDYGHSGHKTDHRVVADSPWPWDHWPLAVLLGNAAASCDGLRHQHVFSQ